MGEVEPESVGVFGVVSAPSNSQGFSCSAISISWPINPSAIFYFLTIGAFSSFLRSISSTPYVVIFLSSSLRMWNFNTLSQQYDEAWKGQAFLSFWFGRWLTLRSWYVFRTWCMLIGLLFQWTICCHFGGGEARAHNVNPHLGLDC